MATNNQKKPFAFQGKVDGLIDGFTATPSPAFDSLMIQGQQQANTAIIADLQAIDARITAVVTARAAYSLAVANRKANSATDDLYVASIVAALKLQLYGDQAVLNTFGIEPTKARTTVSPQTKVVAAAKAAATRVARGTMSKQKRQAITTVPAPTVSVAGVTTTAAPAASPATAPAASPAAPVPTSSAGH